MKKNLAVILMVGVVMPLYFFSDLGYSAQSKNPMTYDKEEALSNITDDSALNPSNVEVHTTINNLSYSPVN